MRVLLSDSEENLHRISNQVNTQRKSESKSEDEYGENKSWVATLIFWLFIVHYQLCA